MDGRGVPVRYEAIDHALAVVGDHAIALGTAAHMPRGGCGPAGGTWSRVEQLITERPVRRGTPVTV
ncbi:hypothetical protein [Streptomyces incanus]|uniref:Uncharacterized protein n=1 Tax=Streptomyces incanus TaxID=887453 RepID=A0ABW0XRN0_9ACTN